ncbi:MAG: hypothetical protein J6C33_04950 [Lachnospiraceae bacterium]|nr:hypothetical protein [Lachnospiraceae bacterium]
MNYQYTELDYAKNIYENGFQSKQHEPTELRLVATYMRRVLDYKPKKLREEMYRWCEDHISGYKKELYYKRIHSAINKACQKGSMLTNVESIAFFKYETDYINGLYIMDNTDEQKESEYSYECKKLLFTLLFKMKINKFITETKRTDSDFEYQGKYFKGGQKKYTELKKLAKLPDKIRIHEDIINTLWINGLVTPMFNGLIKLNFMEKLYEIENSHHDLDKTVVLQIKDYDRVGWYFDYYNQDEKILFCKECGKIFRKRSNRQEYCSNECFEERRRKYKAEKQREYRQSSGRGQLKKSESP